MSSPSTVADAGVGQQDGDEQAEERRFPRPVGADHAEQLAAFDGERDAVERRRSVEALDEAVDGDGGGSVGHRHSSVRPGAKRTSPGIPTLSRPSGLGTRTSKA